MRRGDIYWADLGHSRGSAPAKRRPVLVVQADSFNASSIATVIGAVITSNMRLGAAPGNVTLPKSTSRLPKDSVVNASQIVTIDETALTEHVSSLDRETMGEVAAGLRLVLDL